MTLSVLKWQLALVKPHEMSHRGAQRSICRSAVKSMVNHLPGLLLNLGVVGEKDVICVSCSINQRALAWLETSHKV